MRYPAALVALALCVYPAALLAQTGDVATNLAISDMRSHVDGTAAGDLALSASDLADLQLALDRLASAQTAKRQKRDSAAAKHLAAGTKKAERLVKRKPEWADAWMVLARLRLEAGEWKEGKAAFETVLAIDPKNEQAKAGADLCRWHLAREG